MQMTTRRTGMKLGKRPKRKQDQALDVVASAAKTWSEWQLAKRAGKGVRKGAKKAAELRGGKSSGLKGAITGTPARITGALALVGGLGAVLARKLRGGGGDAYAPPAPHEPAAAPPAPPPQAVAAPSPTASAIAHNATPPPSLQAAPEPDADLVTEPDEPVEAIAMPDRNVLVDDAGAADDADADSDDDDKPAKDDDKD
jgi:hypothetical protein